MRTLAFVAWGLCVGAPLCAEPGEATPVQQQLREVFKELVEINTTDSAGSCTVAAEAMAVRLKAGGFPPQDVQVVVPAGAPKKGNLVARLKGTATGKKPILMLAHIDVVEAKREDWARDPFTLVEEDGYFYARGASDDKAMAAAFVENMIRYRQEAYRPDRDLILALTCDEEIIPSKFDGVDYLLRNRRELIDAGIALNEGANGRLSKDGKYLRLAIQAGEKVSQSYQLEVTNPGGHSSVPTKDNAIYRLADGLSRLSRFDFPFRLLGTTRSYYERMSAIESGQAAADMKAILSNPPDPTAITRLSSSAYDNATLRTTCVATMVEAGHAANALPQRARATVNCRILPGESVSEVEETLARVVADDKIKITPIGQAVTSAQPPLTPELTRAVETVAGQMWPGVPVVPILLTAATDGRFLNNAGIPTYGVSGIFGDPDSSGIHGLNERIRVRSLYECQEFLYRLVKLLADGP